MLTPEEFKSKWAIATVGAVSGATGATIGNYYARVKPWQQSYDATHHQLTTLHRQQLAANHFLATAQSEHNPGATNFLKSQLNSEQVQIHTLTTHEVPNGQLQEISESLGLIVGSALVMGALAKAAQHGYSRWQHRHDIPQLVQAPSIESIP